MEKQTDTHNLMLGYIMWIFGFIGMHRFYYGKKLTGTLWFFTCGLFLIGWFIDLFLIPGMEEQADRNYQEGPVDYNICWILLVFAGYFGIHRFYMNKIWTGLLYLCTAGLFGFGWLYDLWTLNEQITDIHTESSST